MSLRTGPGCRNSRRPPILGTGGAELAPPHYVASSQDGTREGRGIPAINLVIGIPSPVAGAVSCPEAWASDYLQSLSAPGRHTGSGPGQPGWPELSLGDPDGRSVPGNAL